MSSYSYQDINTRLKVVEAKLDLVLRMATVTKRTPSTIMPGEFITEQMSLLDLYKELAASGGNLIDAPAEEVNGAE